MTKKRILKISLLVVAVVVIIGGSLAYYMFNMPHRDIQATQTDYTLKSSDIVNEYLSNADLANEKYLDSEGESKIIEVTGNVFEVSEDFNDNKVVILKLEGGKAGVSCTFSKETNSNASKLKKGDKITIKGVIRSGASFDKDLGMYEDVIMEKCDVVSNK